MNKPVAWIKQGRLGFPVLEFDMPFRYKSYAIQNQPIPLYTHPAGLTDEEIIEFIESWEGLVVTKRTMEMLRAILRKAQEK